MNEIIDFFNEHWGNIVAVCGVLGIGLEISPIEINPISCLLKKMGSVMNADIIDKVDKLEEELHSLREDEDLEKINNIRKEIVDFSLSCQRDEHHTRDEYDRIFDRVAIYHELLNKYKMENGKIDIEVSYIQKIYAACLEQHKFFAG